MGRECRYLPEQAHDLRDGYGRRLFPTLGICVFDHKAGYVATDWNAIRCPLRLTVDTTPCSGFDGYRRSASHKG